MNVLVINAGSSSLKYQLIAVEEHKVLAKGNCERVGTSESFHKYGLGDDTYVDKVEMPNHDVAMREVLKALTSGPTKAVDSLDEIDAVGHRVVQGGKYFDCSVIVDEEVVRKIDELAELAPLHNKAAIMGIRACQKSMPGKPMVTVFDSAYFYTLPPKAYLYPIPYDIYEKHAIRKYGAHGTSHRYVAQRAADFLGKPIENLKIITCHLGGGCSMSAIKGGIAVDTSMGLTPLDGLMMATRCGGIDPSILTYWMQHDGVTPQEMNNILNKQSGLLGISGISGDMRDITEAMNAGDKRAQLAYDMLVYSVRKYIGQYMGVMGGVDVVVFTAGVGEHQTNLREDVFEGWESLGVEIDSVKNEAARGESIISSDASRVRVLMIPTDEEYAIAKDTYDLIHRD